MDTTEQGLIYSYPSRARVGRGSDENSNIPYDNHNVSIFVNIASNNQSITVLLFYYKTCVKEKRNQTSRNSIHFPLFIYLGKISDSKSARNCQNSWWSLTDGWIIWRNDRSTDKAGCRVACTRLKSRLFDWSSRRSAEQHSISRLNYAQGRVSVCAEFGITILAEDRFPASSSSPSTSSTSCINKSVSSVDT